MSSTQTRTITEYSVNTRVDAVRRAVRLDMHMYVLRMGGSKSELTTQSPIRRAPP